MTITVELTPAQAMYLKFLEAHKIKEEKREYITQNQAYLRFGRTNVEAWVEAREVKQHHRGRTIEYKYTELTKAAENLQSYLSREAKDWAYNQNKD